ncbi:hypothetical protein P4132_13750 [Pseudomonas aeruginosa]|nr:hypothetical protein [Pseudomonas aeruginosa]
MHTGETLAAAPPARPLRQSRLGGLSLFLALAGVAIALVVMALALGERIDLSDENHLLGLFAASGGLRGIDLRPGAGPGRPARGAAASVTWPWPASSSTCRACSGAGMR